LGRSFFDAKKSASFGTRKWRYIIMSIIGKVVIGVVVATAAYVGKWVWDTHVYWRSFKKGQRKYHLGMAKETLTRWFKNTVPLTSNEADVQLALQDNTVLRVQHVLLVQSIKASTVKNRAELFAKLFTYYTDQIRLAKAMDDVHVAEQEVEELRAIQTDMSSLGVFATGAAEQTGHG
jgi:hypothetical protein